MTAAVSHLVETGQLNPAPLLNAIWREMGTLDQEDWNTNQRALKFGDRLLSSYDIDAGDESRLWIITEADRSSTTLCSLAITDLAPRRFLPLHPAGYADTRRDVHALLRSSPQEMHMNARPNRPPWPPSPEHQPDRLHRRVRRRAPGVAQSLQPPVYTGSDNSPPVGDGPTQAQALRGPGRGRPGHHRPAAGPSRAGRIINAEMGTGKTMMAIAVAAVMHAPAIAGPWSSLRRTWSTSGAARSGDHPSRPRLGTQWPRYSAQAAQAARSDGRRLRRTPGVLHPRPRADADGFPLAARLLEEARRRWPTARCVPGLRPGPRGPGRQPGHGGGVRAW